MLDDIAAYIVQFLITDLKIFSHYLISFIFFKYIIILLICLYIFKAVLEQIIENKRLISFQLTY